MRSYILAFVAVAVTFGTLSTHAVGAFEDLAHRSRSLQAISFSASNGLNAAVLITPSAAVGAVCGVQIQSANYNSTGTAPIYVGVGVGQSSSLTYATGNSSLYLNVSTSAGSNPRLLDPTVFSGNVDPLTGLNQTTFSAVNASAGDNVTVVAGVYSIVPGSSPVQTDPTVVCVINVTFAVIPPSPPGATSSIVSSSTTINGFPSATGTTTTLPLGIPVTTGNVDGTNRGFGNNGMNNVGNGNTGNCNQGDGNIGNFNKGEGNRGDCNIGNGNVGNGFLGSGNTSGGNGPNYPCSCTITAVASAG